MSWEEAHWTCVSHNADLASITSLAENSFLSNLAGAVTPIWIGANDRETEGTFTWSDGTPMDLANITGIQTKPDDVNESQDCVTMLDATQWEEDHCNSKHAFICKTHSFSSITGKKL